MRVLLSAFACSPALGSEPGAGWAWVAAAAERHDCTALIAEEHSDAVLAELAGRPDLRLKVIAIGDPPWLRRLGPRMVRLSNAVWQVRARGRARQMHAADPFDVTHHVTLSADWQPVGLARLDGPAFVWGPVGGATPTPRALLRWLGGRGLAIEAARLMICGVGRRLWGDPAASRSSIVLCQNAEVAARFARRSHTIVQPHVALNRGWLEPTEVQSTGVALPSGKVAVYVGRLLEWKGLALALAALSEPAARDWSLVIVGDGPDRSRLEAIARKRGLTDRVTFLGQIPRPEVSSILDRCDALLFPSVHEAAGWVNAEATARGCPVVALDHGGPAALVGPGEGRLVHPDRQAPAGLADALANTRDRISPVRRWSAERLPQFLDDVYAEAVARQASRG